MTNFSFVQLVDIGQIRQLLEAQYKITGILSAILDTDENILVAVGWQDICTRFHRVHTVTCERCRESDAYIKANMRDFSGGYLDYRCRNGLRDVAMPIIIGGEHLATFFTGQFFYDDDKPDLEFFRVQAREFGFDEDAYLAALGRVPICTREQIRNIMEYYGNLVRMMAELGLKNLYLTWEVAERKKAETAQKESREYLDKIINSIADPIFVKDREHRLVLVNDAECALAGRSRDEIVGRTDYDFFPREQVEVFWEKDEIVFATERENVNEEEITGAQGEKRAIVTKKSLYKDRNGNKFIVGIIRDITEIKQRELELRTLNRQLLDAQAELERRVEERTAELKNTIDQLCASEAEKSLILDSTTDLVIYHDPDMKIRWVNRKGHILANIPLRELTGRYCWEVFHRRTGPCEGCPVVSAMSTGEPQKGEICAAEGRTLFVRAYPVKSDRGALLGTVEFVLDITDRKRAEEQLVEQKQLLETLNSTLEKRVDEEVAKNRAKDIILIQQNRQAALGEMLNHIAHQWKQPINSASLIVQDLEETWSCGEMTDDYVRESVHKTVQLLEHMAQTIDVFRDFYKPEKRKTAFCIKDAIDNALAFISSALRFHYIGVELDVDPGLSAVGYPKEYAQVLLNILGNAKNALVEGKIVKPLLKIRAFAEDGNAAVTITDNAGGIPEMNIGKIFDPYFTTRNKAGGTGIGLYMSKNIIENNMGGALSVTNVDGGAQFRMEIPLP